MTDAQFTQLAERYMDMVYRIAFNALGNGADAEDVVQNVMLRLYRSGPDFESQAHAKYWLCRVAVNESRRLAGAPWRKKVISMDALRFAAAPEPEQRELLQTVMSLPEKYRLPLYLYYYEDYSVAQISRILGRGQSTIQTQLARARRLLKDKLTKEGGT